MSAFLRCLGSSFPRTIYLSFTEKCIVIVKPRNRVATDSLSLLLMVALCPRIHHRRHLRLQTAAPGMIHSCGLWQLILLNSFVIFDWQVSKLIRLSLAQTLLTHHSNIARSPRFAARWKSTGASKRSRQVVCFCCMA